MELSKFLLGASSAAALAASGAARLTLGLTGGASIAANEATVSRATFVDASGLPDSGKPVTFAGAQTLIKFTASAIPVSSCTLNLQPSGTRPCNGRLVVLAHAAGEVDFGDAKGNNISSGSSVAARAVDRIVDASNGTMSSADPFVVPNSMDPARVQFGFRACQNGALINISVATPLGTVTSTDFVIP